MLGKYFPSRNVSLEKFRNEVEIENITSVKFKGVRLACNAMHYIDLISSWKKITSKYGN